MKKIAKTLSLFDLMQEYSTQSKAIRYFENIRWGDNPVCVKCGCQSKITAQKKEGDYWCGECRSYFNALAGTPLERSKIDIRKWIYAAYILLTSRKGVSSLQLSKELGITQKTAWYILHRLRTACDVQNGTLKGTAEVDETYIGGKEANKHTHKRIKHSQGGANKSIIFGMRQRQGRLKAQVITDTKSSTLQNVLSKNVDKSTLLYTDDLRGYRGVDFDKVRVNHSAKEYVNGMAHTNGIESVWAVLERGYNGVYHNFSKKHLKHYVNEFVFRLNEGNCQIDTQDRLNSLFKAMAGKEITYRGLVE